MVFEASDIFIGPWKAGRATALYPVPHCTPVVKNALPGKSQALGSSSLPSPSSESCLEGHFSNKLQAGIQTPLVWLNKANEPPVKTRVVGGRIPGFQPQCTRWPRTSTPWPFPAPSCAFLDRRFIWPRWKARITSPRNRKMRRAIWTRDSFPHASKAKRLLTSVLLCQNERRKGRRKGVEGEKAWGEACAADRHVWRAAGFWYLCTMASAFPRKAFVGDTPIIPFRSDRASVCPRWKASTM